MGVFLCRNIILLPASAAGQFFHLPRVLENRVRDLRASQYPGQLLHRLPVCELPDTRAGAAIFHCLLDQVVGVGLRCQKQGSNLVMNLGFSHQVIISDTDDIKIEWKDPNNFTITGIDKQKVGQFAAEVRAKKPPEPYKGKGIRYKGEVVKHKEGKAGKGKK